MFLKNALKVKKKKEVKIEKSLTKITFEPLKRKKEKSFKPHYLFIQYTY